MESESQLGTYIAYGFVCLFLTVVVIAAIRSYSMIMSLVLLLFSGNTKPDTDSGTMTKDTED
ncbi:MAG: hypothetical protein ACO1Q7_08190 [Gemmatimonas sp.]